MSKFNARLLQLITNQGLNKTEFSIKCGISRATVSTIISKGHLPSVDFAAKILTTYKNLNARWLLTGEGEMWRDEPQTAQAADARPPMPVTYKEADTEGNIVHEPAHGPEHYRMVIETQRKTIEAYERLLSMYDSHNAGNAQKAG